MKTTLLLASGAFSILVFSASDRAYGWGQYGHEQGNDAAIELLSGTPLGSCFSTDKARYVIRRMAVVPDIEWKTDMTMLGKTLSPEDFKKWHDNDKYEHPMHFDEVDAWVPNPKKGDIANLLASAQKFTKAGSSEYEYKKLYPFFKDRLQKNASYVTTVDPDKVLKDPSNASVNEVTDHGTAPWRAVQMFRNGVDALKKGDLKLAMLYLGTMGHYVCDMSMPFHASLNFDGQYNPDGKSGNYASRGIHHEIDTGVLPQTGKDKNDVYPSFDKTSSTVVDAGEAAIKAKGGLKGMTEADIVPDMLQMIDDGYHNVSEFLGFYTEQCAKANGGAAAGKFKAACDTTNDPGCDQGGTKTTRRKRSPKVGENPQAPRPSHAPPGTGDSTDDGSDAANVPFCTQPPKKPGDKRSPSPKPLHKADENEFAQKVLSTVEDRLGACSGLLARMWTAAYQAAGSPKLNGCDSIEFDQSFAIQNYPRPSKDGPNGYLPDGYTPGHR